MTNKFATMTNSEKWWLLVEAAKSALESKGYVLERVPGRGRANTWEAAIGGKSSRLSIRTTQDRYIAFPPLEGGTSWKTLDKVELVAVAAVHDWRDSPDIDVYLFEADVVRQHFNDAYAARKADGQKVTDNFGMWVGLDRDDRNVPASVGAGIATGHEPIATYSMSELIAKSGVAGLDAQPESDDLVDDGETLSIAQVLDRTRQLISTISGVPVDAVKLDCKIAY